MDEATRLTQKAMQLSKRVEISARLARFEIDGTTRNNLAAVMPTLVAGIDRIIVRFYEYLDHFPETRLLLAGHDIGRLRQRQKHHWLRLFSCDFTEDYVHSSLLIGFAHFHARVPPHIYIAAYSFFLTDLLRVVGNTHKGLDLAAATTSISKVVMLDMSIALNAFLLDALSGKQ